MLLRKKKKDREDFYERQNCDSGQQLQSLECGKSYIVVSENVLATITHTYTLHAALYYLLHINNILCKLKQTMKTEMKTI